MYSQFCYVLSVPVIYYHAYYTEFSTDKPPVYINEQPAAPPDYQQLHTYATINDPHAQPEYMYTTVTPGQPGGVVMQPQGGQNVQVISAAPVQVRDTLANCY